MINTGMESSDNVDFLFSVVTQNWRTATHRLPMSQIVVFHYFYHYFYYYFYNYYYCYYYHYH